ncbi:hypothetical protein K438DRAFT_1777875 [Mycena galopus ATCC 62051]|nr:hypothetical protein K438DRAFT_1777875 [Mycena galopus ATCC 62051]
METNMKEEGLRQNQMSTAIGTGTTGSDNEPEAADVASPHGEPERTVESGVVERTIGLSRCRAKGTGSRRKASTETIKKTNKIENGKEKRGVCGGEKVVWREEAAASRLAERKETQQGAVEMRKLRACEILGEPRVGCDEAAGARRRARGRRKKPRAKNSLEAAPAYTHNIATRAADEMHRKKRDRDKGQPGKNKRKKNVEQRAEFLLTTGRHSPTDSGNDDEDEGRASKYNRYHYVTTTMKDGYTEGYRHQ